MITGSEEYKEYLATIARTYDPPKISMRIPTDEPVYEVNLNTRVITPPPFLGVEADHESEFIYFKMDRFYDQMDLSTCIGIIQFQNAKHEEYYYIIPYYDIESISGKMIFAWDIQSPATKYGGAVSFSFKFFQVNLEGELLYELNTMVARTKVLVGWATKLGINHTIKPNKQISLKDILANDELITRIDYLLSLVDNEKKLHLYWTDV